MLPVAVHGYERHGCGGTGSPSRRRALAFSNMLGRYGVRRDLRQNTRSGAWAHLEGVPSAVSRPRSPGYFYSGRLDKAEGHVEEVGTMASKFKLLPVHTPPGI